MAVVKPRHTPDPAREAAWRPRAALAATLLAGALLLAGCSAIRTPPEVRNSPSIYSDPDASRPPKSLGFASQDIINLTDAMMRDILAHTFWRRRGKPPRIILDINCFTNQGAGDINLRLITDRLRVELNRAAKGKLVFVAPYLYQYHLFADDPYDRDLASRGIYPHDAVYRLCGNITTLDIQSYDRDLVSRYSQVTLEIVERKTAVLVWGGVYSFRKTANRAEVDPRSAHLLSTRPSPAPWRGSANADPLDTIF